jgi:predicted outer membrane repeat protein
MNSTHVTQLVRGLPALPTRRAVLVGLATVLGPAVTGIPRAVEARKKGKKKKKKCAKSGQAPKKGKKCCKGLGKDGAGRCAPPCEVCADGCFFSTVQEAIDLADPGQTIRLCAGVFDENILINKNLTLIGAGDGSGAGNTILRGLGTNSVVRVTNSVSTATLKGLRITGGAWGTLGGGISSHADALTVTDCTVTGNTSTTNGGGIFSFAALVLNSSTVSGNGTNYRGGGILANGTLEVTNSTITDNWAESGGGVFNDGHTLTLTNSTVSENTASDSGGGIYNEDGTVVFDAASRVTGNEAEDSNGGGIYTIGGEVSLNKPANVADNTPDNCGGPNPVDLCANP